MATAAAEDFIRNFHSLEGVTVGQRRKNFFKLLHQNASLKANEDIVNVIATNLKPATYLEELFKVELLIYFRRRQELFQLIKEGNDVFVSKITKQKWFFEEMFNEVDGKKLVNDVLPAMSFSVRMKVLRKLSRYLNSEQFDKVFDAVIERYGIFIASQFLSGCSSDKVREMIKKHNFTLTEHQLMILYKKDAGLIEFYFTNIRNLSKYSYRKLRKFLYTENFALYSRLQEKFKFEKIKFGRRLTKKIVVVERDDIVREPNVYLNLDMRAVIRKLGKDAEKMFINSLPSFNDYMDVCNFKILQYFANKYQYNLIFKVVPIHYQIQYINYPKIINGSLLKLETDNEKRALLAKVKVDLGEDKYIKYLTTKESIPLLKERINVTSEIWKRSELIRWLVETCHINNDMKSLVDVMKYFVSRHKNDDGGVITAFLHKIEDRFGFSSFTEEIWNLFYDIQITYTLKRDHDVDTYNKIQTKPLAKYFIAGSTHQHFSYLNFLFNKNESIDELLKEMFSRDERYPNVRYPTWGAYGKEFEKYILMYIIKEHGDEGYQDADTITFNCYLIKEMVSWNAQYPDDQFNFYDFPFLVRSFDYAIKRFDNYYKVDIVSLFRSKIFTTKDNKFKKDYLLIYLENLKRFGSIDDFKWFLTFEPTVIEQNFQEFIGNLLDNFSDTSKNVRHRRRSSLMRKTSYEPSLLRAVYKMKMFSHLSLDKRSIEFCLSKIRDEDCQDYKPQYVGCLSVLMKPDEYVSFADSYKPESKKLDLQNEKEVKLYSLQCTIGENFKNTKHYSVLLSLFNYCVGDYFHHSLRSLYSILYRTPENLLPRYLNLLAKKAVSVRKHALYLTCELTTVQQVENMLKLLNKSEGVLSLQKYMFSSSIKYFLKNPLDQFFEIAKSNLSFITKEDRESLKMIVEKVSDIPIEYRCQYIEHSWNHFEKIIEVKRDLLEMKNDLLYRMSDVELIKRMSFEFGKKIICQHFTNDESMKVNGISEFTFLFLLERNEKTIILDIVTDIVDKYERREQFNFFYDWYRCIMDCEKDDLRFLNPFVHYFEKKIDVIQNFYEYVKIFFLKTKIELSVDHSFDELHTKIFNFLDGLVANYGPHIVKLFANELNNIISYFQQEENDLCYNLIKNHPVTNVAVLVLDVVSQPEESEIKKRETYRNIFRLIKNIPDPVIQIILYKDHKDYLQSKYFLS